MYFSLIFKYLNNNAYLKNKNKEKQHNYDQKKKKLQINSYKTPQIEKNFL